MTLEELRRKKDVAVVVAGHNGKIQFVNERFTDLFGWNLKEITGRPLSTIIPPTLHDAHNLGFSRFLTTEKPSLLNQPLKLKAVTKDGKVFEAEHFITAEKSEGHWQFGASIRPL